MTCQFQVPVKFHLKTNITHRTSAILVFSVKLSMEFLQQARSLPVVLSAASQCCEKSYPDQLVLELKLLNKFEGF